MKEDNTIVVSEGEIGDFKAQRINEYDIVLDFSGDEMDDAARKRLIQAVTEKKKLKTKMMFFGDGDYNAIATPEVSIIFNTNTSVGLGQDMGLEMNLEFTDEEIEESQKDLKENGYDDGYNVYLEDSKDDFLD